MNSIRLFPVELPLTSQTQCETAARAIVAQVKPEWDANRLHFRVFTAGITNKIFCCYPDAAGDGYGVDDGDRLIFRVFGKNTETIIDRNHELESWNILASKGLAAKIHGRFQNGLVCGYLMGEPLDVTTVREPHISSLVANSISRMHQIEVDRTPCWYPKVQSFYNTLKLRETSIEDFCLDTLRKEIDDVQHLIHKHSDIVFCHNDLLVHNIIYNKSEDKINFIDYEYADANYALFDVANHFCEFAGVENVDYSQCPSREQKEIFLRNYFESRLGFVSDSKLEDALHDVSLFEAASHLFWATWALVQETQSLIDFDYHAYAILRYDQYKKRLEKYLGK